MRDKRTDTQDRALTPAEERFVRVAGERLQRSTNELDAATRTRLHQARQKALDEISGGSRPTTPGWWLPAGATAVAAILVVGIWRAGGPEQDAAVSPIDAVPVTADGIADVELLLDDGELEMLEDLEFFAWLAAEELEAAG